MRTVCQVEHLTCELQENPIGMDELAPRLSWKMNDPRPGARQTAWQIQAASTPRHLRSSPDLWDTRKVKGNESLDHIYGGPALRSRQRVWWRVRVWDRQGKASGWSRPSFFEMGLLKKSDWRADWIGSGRKATPQSPCPHFRKEFQLEQTPVNARLYITALGIFEVYINGKRVGNDYFVPGWTVYDKRVNYLTYDVTDLLQAGGNVLGAIVAPGWYAGRLGWERRRDLANRKVELRVQLELETPAGKRQRILSGKDWVWREGPHRAADFYDGEHYDARRELGAWNEPGGRSAGWEKVRKMPGAQVTLTAKRNLPVRRQEELKARKLTQPKPGMWVFDLGQNMVGFARIRARVQKGQRIQLRFGEMLNADGTIYTENLRSAKSTDSYTAAKTGVIEWEPHFTFHGFRYVEVTGLRGKPGLADVTGVVLHSDIAPTGAFACSKPIINRLQKNILWGQKGNFLEAPTDCPQRDERLGWTGDAQVFVRTASFNRDVAAFFEQWALSVADDQYPDGRIPHVVPNVLRKGNGGAAAWADAVVICPWTIYQCYGDKRILERSYESMCKWVDWRVKTARNGVHDWPTFGDWLAIDIAQNSPGKSPTPKDLISTAYFAYTAGLVARVAGILGHAADARRYREIQQKVTAAFNREFVSGSGRLTGDTQTGYLLALGWDLLPAEKRAYAAERLVHELESRQWHLSTGFVGTPLLAPVLSQIGRTDIAYKLLLQETYPGWLYSIRQGATTMWERWNSYTKKDGFGDVRMNSFNHYAYGAIGEWLYATVAGIGLDPAHPGYKHVIFRPEPGAGLAWARGHLETRYGRVSCSWRATGRNLRVKVSLPPNTTGTVILPGRRSVEISAGEHGFRARWK